jgi:hypothetical protein
MAYDGSYFTGNYFTGGRFIRYTVEFWAWFFDCLRFIYSPGVRESLHLDGATIRADTIADTPRAAPFKAFIARVRAHSEFYGGRGFMPDYAL